MSFLVGFYIINAIVSYQIMKKGGIDYLKRIKEDGYNVKFSNGKSLKSAMLILSLIPAVHILVPLMHFTDMTIGKDKAYQSNKNLESIQDGIYKSDNFDNIDSVIKDLEENNLILQIKKITKFKDIKDKIKLNKIMDIFKLNKNKTENEIAQLIANEYDLTEAISQLQKNIGAQNIEMSYHDLMDERMKNVPVIHVIDEESTKDIDAVVIPTIDFSISNEDEDINGYQRMHH